MDDEIKTQASEAFAAMGLSVSDAVGNLLKRVVSNQTLPLELKVPNAQTRAAMEEARAMTKARRPFLTLLTPLIDGLEKPGTKKPGSSKPATPRSACNYTKTFLNDRNASCAQAATT